MSRAGSRGGLPPSAWDRVREIFADAVDISLEDRAAFLRSACRNEPELRREVESLLAAHERAEAFLEDAGVTAMAPSLARPALLDRRVGAWRTVELLGRGGMGAVYFAERADGQFEQRAALKIVKRGMDTDSILGRFLKERQILARLDHPNIARLLDGGVTDDGLPFFVMEHVEGSPITRYCDERRLDIEARVRLFAEVCRAVQYAHRNLVVHRDLKPSNILVTDRGQVKLLDFGIAKLLEGDGSATTLTAAGLRPLTPEYAAPEHLRGEPVTTAADVYSLGALLYEVLTGELPFRLSCRDPAGAAEVIAGAPPGPPSRAVAAAGPGSGDKPPRGSSVRRARRRLEGDLDTIVLTALQPEPDRRYPSAEALLQDLRRWLDGLPIQARPDSAVYRASKFVRRHRGGVAASAAVLLLLTGTVVVTVVENAQTARERDRARLEATKTRRVSEFLTGIFEVSDPNVSRGAEITARELLQAGAARLATELSDQPEVEAELSSVIADVYEKLGDYDRGMLLAERALELRRSLHGPSARETALSLYDLGRLHRLNGDYLLADSLLGEALALSEHRPGEARGEIAATLDQLGLLRRTQGRLEVADSLHRAALALRRSAEEPVPTDVAASLARLGVLARARGDLETAEAYHREALDLRLKALGEDDRLVAESRKDLALVLHSASRLDEAEALYRRVLEFEERLYSGRHPEIGTTLNNLGSLLRQRGEFGEAETMLRRSVALRRELMGPDHSQIATSLANLGALLGDAGRPGDAAAVYEEAVAMQRRIFGPDHPAVATTLNNLGVVLGDQGKYDVASASLREAVRIYEARLGSGHYFRAFPMYNLARLHLWRGNLAAAESLYREANALMRKALPADHPEVATGVMGLGEVAVLSGRAAQAEPLLREALAVREKTLGAHWRVAEARSVLGDCLSRLGRIQEAEPLLVSGHRGLAEALGERSIHTDRAGQRLEDHRRRHGSG